MYSIVYRSVSHGFARLGNTYFQYNDFSLTGSRFILYIFLELRLCIIAGSDALGLILYFIGRVCSSLR